MQIIRVIISCNSIDNLLEVYKKLLELTRNPYMTKEEFLQKLTDSGDVSGNVGGDVGGNVGGVVLRLCKSKYPYNGQPK